MNENKIALIGTFLIHLLLLILLLLVKYGPDIQFSRIEILEFGYLETANNYKYISPQASSQDNSGDIAEGSKTNLIPEKVNLPNKISQDNEDLLQANSEFTAYNQLELNDDVGNSREQSDMPEGVTRGLDENKSELPVVSSDSDYLSSLTSSLDGADGADGPYLLEGDILSRGIVTKVIPQYPAGLQKTSRVKIKFEVDMQGNIDNLLVTQKADPQLEKNSIEALKKWRFSPITKDIIQVGYITFIYQLK